MNQKQSFTLKFSNLPRFDPRETNFDRPIVPYDFVEFPHGILGNRLPQRDPCITHSIAIDPSWFNDDQIKTTTTTNN